MGVRRLYAIMARMPKTQRKQTVAAPEESAFFAKPFSLKGRVAVVTGGQGNLGSEFARVLSGAGAAVAVLDIKATPNPSIAKLAESGAAVKSFRADLTDKKETERAFAEIFASFGAPDILINNAGLAAHPSAPVGENGPFETYPEEAWNAMIDSHLKGMLLVSQAFMQHYRAANKKEGSIINISSTYGIVSPEQALYDFRRAQGGAYYKPVGYSVAKAGVLGFTRWLAEYCAFEKTGIRVNTLVPGGVEAGQSAVFISEYEKRTMLGRMAQNIDYNGAILFLASDASAYMTGATLVVDGGWTAR